MQARCQCGQLIVDLPGPSPAVVACHCIDCQRRSGSPFGVGVYYPSEAIEISGEATEYVRETATGGSFKSYFCGTCGTTVYWIAGKHPDMIGIASGTLSDSSFAKPVRSVWEQSKHDWVDIDCVPEHFPKGRE